MPRHMCESRVTSATDVCKLAELRPIIRIGLLDHELVSVYDPAEENIEELAARGADVNGSRSLIEATYVGAKAGGVSLIKSWSGYYMDAAIDNGLGYALGLGEQIPSDRRMRKQFGRTIETLLQDQEDVARKLNVYDRAVKGVLAPYTQSDLTYSNCVVTQRGTMLSVVMADVSYEKKTPQIIDLPVICGRFNEQALIDFYVNGPRDGSSAYYKKLIEKTRAQQDV